MFTCARMDCPAQVQAHRDSVSKNVPADMGGQLDSGRAPLVKWRFFDSNRLIFHYAAGVDPC